MAHLRHRPLIAMVVGTRPDAIKSAPVYLDLKHNASQVDVVLISTGQHREMLDQVFAAFGISADYELSIMQHGQSLAKLTCRAMAGLNEALDEVRPDFLLAQGDTTTTFVASLTAFYRKVPFGHIEAGLRTHDMDNPFPEEYNRRAAALVATHHYAPTIGARDNLLHEGVNENRIFVTGNTGIDAVHYIINRFEQTWYTDWLGPVLLLTTHRRENWGEPQRSIARAALQIVEVHDDVLLVVSMHKNPLVRGILCDILEGHPRIKLIEPPDYAQFVKLMERSYLILTDSGGVQEEAPSLGKPVLVLRDTTERPEGIEVGNASLVGTDHSNIFDFCNRLLSDMETYTKMSKVASPYGDGYAAKRIRCQLLQWFDIQSSAVPK